MPNGAPFTNVGITSATSATVGRISNAPPTPVENVLYPGSVGMAAEL